MTPSNITLNTKDAAKQPDPTGYKKAWAKGVAYYGIYKSAQKTARIVADRVCHQLTIPRDYDNGFHEAAMQLVKEGMVKVPGQRERIIAHPEHGIELPTWVFVRIPELGLVQVRGDKYNLHFRTPRRADLDKLRELIEVEQEEERSEIVFDPFEIQQNTIIMGWNAKDKQWELRKERPARSFASVVLPAELQADIEADLKAFTESRKRLTRIEMPWRRGYLLSGPPGTGKTSLSLAIAGSLGFKLATLSLSEITSDGDLREAVSKLRPKTVLVIEDIDAYSVSNDREHNTARDGALSLSGLLNSIDGFETPEGLVTIATTNHIENLDPALIREGRFDRTFTVDYIQGPELVRLFEWFYEVKSLGLPLEADRALADAKISPAAVAELFKQHLNDPEAGWAAVLDRIGTGRASESLRVAA